MHLGDGVPLPCEINYLYAAYNLFDSRYAIIITV